MSAPRSLHACAAFKADQTTFSSSTCGFNHMIFAFPSRVVYTGSIIYGRVISCKVLAAGEG